MSKSAKKILNTAETLFYKHSIHAVGVDLIRDQSGCSKTTLYTYFKNKQQLVETVLIERDHKFKMSLFDYLGNAQDREALIRIFEWHIQWFHEESFKGCLFVRAIAERETAEHISQDQHMIQIVQEHKAWIRVLVHQHSRYALCADELAEIIYTLLEGLISRFLVEGFSEKLVINTRNALNKILNVLC